MTSFDDRSARSGANEGSGGQSPGAKSLYRRLSDSLFDPMPITTGPWRPDAQHGGPPSALLAHLCEQAVDDGETTARIRVELLTGIPLEPLESTVERRPVSRRVAHVEAELRQGSRPVARATALVLATGDMPEPAWRLERPNHPDWRQTESRTAPHWAAGPDEPVFHRDGLEHRFVVGAFDAAGPATDWVRLRYPVVDDVETTGVQQIMASVDVGSGISAVFDPSEGFGLINADLDVAFVAPAHGDWLLLDAVTHPGPDGTGLAVTRVYDEVGLVAVATQCLLGTAFNPG
ncbi:MAG: thioesterase family protein [Acidimicrobiia bacterium]|nr:thioesterase family protein [Acidimicrobiia bacterium]